MGQIRLLAYCVIAGAIGILAFSGVTLWHSAYDLNAKFPALAAVSAVCVLAIECLGFGVAMVLWRFRAYLWVGIATFLTLAMALYLMRLDMNVNVGGRADREAQREASVEERRADRDELATQKALRSRLQEKTKLTVDERRALQEARRRIAALEARWGAHIVVAEERAPDASLLARWFGLDLQLVDDIMVALPVFLQVLVRLFCLPIGLRLLFIAHEQEEAARAAAAVRKSSPASENPTPGGEDEPEVAVSAPPVHTGERLGPNGRRVTSAAVPKYLNEGHGQRSAVVYGEAPPSRIARAASQALVQGSVAAFIEGELVHSDARDAKGKPRYFLKASRAYKAYQDWCATRAGGGISAVGMPQFGRAFAEATGQPAVTRGNGAFYAGWRLKTEVGLGEVGRSARNKDEALVVAHH